MNQGVRTAPGVNGTVVVLAAWCSRCREEVMPSESGHCVWCGTQVVDLDRLKIRDAIASTTTTGGASMTATATATGTAWCKRENCDQPAEDRVGPYAKLCSEHKAEARAQRAATPTPPLASRSSTGGGTSLGDLAKKLVPLAKAVDKARAQLAKTPSSQGAKAAFDEATRRASVRPTPENLQRVVEATKALQQGAPRRIKLENDVAQAERALALALQSFAREAQAA